MSVTTVVTNVSSPVFGIPGRSTTTLPAAGSRPPLRTAAPSERRVDQHGGSWGYGPFLRRRGAESGDVLTIRFDLAAEQVMLVLADETDLEE